MTERQWQIIRPLIDLWKAEQELEAARERLLRPEPKPFPRRI